MKELLQPFNITHPSSQDLDRVFKFMIEYDIAEMGEADSDIEDLADQWSKVDLSEDVWISQNDSGAINGYAILSEEGERGRFLDFYTIRNTSPQGLAGVLIDTALQRFRSLIQSGKSSPDCSLTTYVSGANAQYRAELESRNFSVQTYHYRMQIDFQGEFPAPVWPQEYTLTPYTPQEEQELYELITAAFTWPGHTMTSIEAWREALFRNGRYDPEYFVMVRQAGRLVGAALSYNEGVRGWIRQLAVSPDLQGKGLGSLLLRHMFRVYFEKGVPSVALGVASANETANRFYERNGMTRTREFVEYRL